MIVVVTTAPGREHVGNLETALRGHQACWVTDTHLHGARRNYWRALRTALDIVDRYRLPQILICEDDIELCAHAIDYIDSFVVPEEMAFVEWFNGQDDAQSWVLKPAPGGLVPGAWMKEARHRVVCTQAITYPRDTLAALVAEPLPLWWPMDPNPGRPPGDPDDLVRWIVGERAWRYGTHLPNLVQHVGAVSLIDPARTLTGGRVSKNYPGADFDARTLWAGKAVDHAGG